MPPTTAPPSEVPPQPVDPPDGVEITPPLDGEAIDPGDQVVDVGHLSAPEREELEAELDPAPVLAETGHDDSGTAILGFVVFATGVGLTALGSWRRRSRGGRPRGSAG
jgi:hypothetical protein